MEFIFNVSDTWLCPYLIIIRLSETILCETGGTDCVHPWISPKSKWKFYSLFAHFSLSCIHSSKLGWCIQV